MKIDRRRLLAAALLTAAACGDGIPPPPAPGPGALPFVEISMVLPVNSIAVGQSARAQLFGRRTDGSTAELVGVGIWTSMNPSVVSVAPTGIFTALAPGTTDLAVSYQSFNSRRTLAVRPLSPGDLPLRVAVMLTAARVPDERDVDRVFAKANDLFFSLTRERLLRVALFNAGQGVPLGQAQQYLSGQPDSMPDAVLAFSDDATAFSFGGYAQTFTVAPPYQNQFLPPSGNGSERAGIAVVHYFHMYARCGYDNALNRVSPTSFGGECRNQAGLQCEDNGRYWQCPDSLTDLYSQPDHFTACTIVHELSHPFGPAGNNDHYGTDACVARTGMSAPERASLSRAQEFCGLCPDVYLRVRHR
jgi:hypothetical protein